MESCQFTETRYAQIRNRLIPKHLSSSVKERRKKEAKKMILTPSAGDNIQIAKAAFLKPINDIEAIMRHFDKQFHPETKAIRTLERESKYLLPQKVTSLLKLPMIQQAKEIREKIEDFEGFAYRLRTKNKILSQFAEYIECEARINPESNRCKTTVK